MGEGEGVKGREREGEGKRSTGRERGGEHRRSVRIYETEYERELVRLSGNI